MLTLSVSTAIIKRAFSVIKFVKTNVCNKKECDFLIDSLMLYIENDIALTFSLDLVKDNFEDLKKHQDLFSKTMY